MNTLSRKLKDETSQNHHLIEKVAAFRNLMSPTLTLEQYNDLIRSWYSFIKPLEDHIKLIAQIDTLFIDLENRFKTPLLEHDLLNLNAHINQPITKVFLPECRSIEECIGILYVMEGSTLGSQIISKKLLQHDFIHADILSFYLGYQDKTGLYWSKFKSAMDQWGFDNPEKHSNVVKSAQSCFLCLAQHMEELSSVE